MTEPVVPDERSDTPILRGGVLDIICEWMLYVSAALIVAGLLTPSVYRPKLIGGDTYTVFGALESLAASGLWALATLVFVFSLSLIHI